ncbi:MAG: hypothetical protein ACO1NO_03575 [Burkholderiaceae bacterium]
MKLRSIALLLSCLLAFTQSAAAEKRPFRFGILVQAIDVKSSEGDFQNALAMLEAEKPAFVVANGMKTAKEACSDELYTERRELFEHSVGPLIPALTATDWTACRNSSGKPAAAERLNRIRELFFSEKSSFGKRKISLVRQSITPQFRSFGENSRWRYRNILFATIHLPANNNNYVSQAGRNSEFEDRLIANRDWLQTLFILAKRKKVDGIVLFSDANPLAPPARADGSGTKTERDGFREIRQQIQKQAANFSGKVLIVHRQASQAEHTRQEPAPQIKWSRNLGELGIAAGAAIVSVGAPPALFVPELIQTEKIAPVDNAPPP